jgi:hypothetical protein
MPTVDMFSVEFWFRFENKSSPEIDKLIGLVNLSKLDEGFQYFFYFNNPDSHISSNFNSFDFYYDSNTNESFFKWTKFRVEYTFQNNENSINNFTEQIYINDVLQNDVQHSVESNTELNDVLSLVIGSDSPSGPTTLSQRCAILNKI